MKEFQSTHKYVGGKQSKLRLLLPYLNKPADVYVEPFAGSLAVLLNRQASRVEIANDLNGSLIRYWRAVQRNPQGVVEWCGRILYHEREYQMGRALANNEMEVSCEEEFAAYYLASIYFGFAAMASEMFHISYRPENRTQVLQRFAEKNIAKISERLHGVQFFARDTLKFLRDNEPKLSGNIDKRETEVPNLFVYCDPPYILPDASTNKKAYQTGGMPVEAHEEMIAILIRSWRANPKLSFAISAYPNDVYDRLLLAEQGINRVEFNVHSTLQNANKDSGKTTKRVEVLYYNFPRNVELFGPIPHIPPITPHKEKP